MRVVERGGLPLVRNSKGKFVKVDKKTSNSNVSAMYLLAGLILLGVIIWVFIGSYSCI